MSSYLHLAEISKQTPKGRHAGVIIDNAGYHHSDELPKYENVSLIPLPSYAPELNSAEQLWEWLRDNDLSNRFFKGYDELSMHAARGGISSFQKLDGCVAYALVLGLLSHS